MPRHHPGVPPADSGHAGHRLCAAVGSGTGLLDGTPAVSPAAGNIGPGPDDPPVPSRIRWRTGRRAAVLLCLVSGALLGWFWWQAANATTEVSPLSSISTADAGDEPARDPVSTTTSAPSAPGTITVHVAGAVVDAGIVELPQGSRLHEAITAAGGSAPDADPDQLNLAAVLEDGQKVLVPRQGETVPAGSGQAADAGGGPAAAAGSPAGGKINLNTAGADELAGLPRIGPVLAQRIVDWRTEHGRFQRVEELDAVDGVGAKMLEALLPLVQV